MENNLEAQLERLGIKALNELQESMLNATLKQEDILLLSQTGSGKTLAFLLPLSRDINPDLRQNQAIVIAPSRELALQIENVFRSLQTGLSVTCCYGGHKREIEENNLSANPALIIGTPGRLADHLRRGNIDPTGIKTLVLDEFDKCLELGFSDEITFIKGSLINLDRKWLISATHLMESPAGFELENINTLDFRSAQMESAPRLEQKLLSFDNTISRQQAAFELICTLQGRSSIIFCNQRDHVETLYQYLKQQGLDLVYYHGAMEQRDRDSALNRFRNGTVNLLITTDLASRGLDIAQIRYIIHYQLPETEQIFIHRNGRTARMDKSGAAIVMIGPEQYLPEYMDPDMEKIILDPNQPLPPKSKWVTLYVAAGKKNKVGKIDIVGFLTKTGGVKKEDIGLIEVKDFSSFVAINRHKVTKLLTNIKEQRLKNKKVKIEVAK
ncbi:Superfamily II DNA and RNA helicase [Arachidicoccus rhizosphaerae]|uniref:Superfamily II DNA and RNA helicase n=1 Tax=Arachidicoccus rhizosphaerae TaxID=551991 RepID=A0A1H4B9J4_9BACT|nr:DEAD/DEAH box helicase [Arachidicoccus rhizosphaerae]SEA44810.1 Superfamily II DNA and RNA helicase [Arachidicoccus rhizosphaerae]